MNRLADRTVHVPTRSGTRHDPVRVAAGLPPAFKPVALPALAAAVGAAKMSPARAPRPDVSAILLRQEGDD
ncbi:hypothetical protein [Microvirga antarctica]|uniref:hypothetical protein n=1 Tax=Microvirga antarctica TaxID=2819233 RepID=UPI001B309334|nr:hypothetical protein [Microvirga antarctica]